MSTSNAHALRHRAVNDTEQVLTQSEHHKSDPAAENRGPTQVEGSLRSIGASSLVIQGLLPTGTRRIPQGSRQQLGRASDSDPSPLPSKSKRRGGWPSSPRLNWRTDVKEINWVAKEIAGQGFPFTHFVTIMPRAGNPALRKRTCSRVVAHIGQLLTRRGHDHLGLTINEHPLDSDLHAHHLVPVPRSEFERVERRRSAACDIHVERITNLDGLLAYLLKQRRRLSPDFEAKLRSSKGPKWQKCRPVPGKRWSMTTAVKELLNAL